MGVSLFSGFFFHLIDRKKKKKSKLNQQTCCLFGFFCISKSYSNESFDEFKKDCLAKQTKKMPSKT